MRTFLIILGIILFLALVGLTVWIFTNLKDRNPDYTADLKIINRELSELKAGFAAITVTPEVPDRWTDTDNDAEYRPKKGDTFTDGNGNGRFDPVWIAGFGNARAANGIHDDLWARTMILDDGNTRLAIIALDAIGLMNDDVIDIRKQLPPETGITYTIITSTHTHEGPDLLGLWGKSSIKSGVNREYLEYVKDQITRSIENALLNIRPVRLEISEDPTGAGSLVNDTRKPVVFDSGLRLIRAIDKENGSTLGTLIAWADHAETLWGKNLLITSDFPYYFRDGVEKGIYNGNILVKPGIGGVVLYVNGAIGGLMTSDTSLVIQDPFTGQEFSEPTFEKAEAQGKQLALLTLNSMENPVENIEMAGISLVVRTIQLPIDNKIFRLATTFGIIDRGASFCMKMRTELSVFNIGPLSFAIFPGEVYPEIINGGVEAPDGQDFSTDPVEVPPVRDMMTGRYKFTFGLANDEIGYIIPKSQWDKKEPFTYESDDSPYGESNSLGAETAIILYKNIKEMLSELNQSGNGN